MTRLRKTALVALVGALMLFVPAGVALAQDDETPVEAPVAVAEATSEAFGVDGIEAGLLALFPLVILISSLVLKPDAAETVKKALPAAVAAIVAVVYFVVDQWPGFGTELVVNLGLLIALAMKLYDPLSAIVKLGTGLRGSSTGLNDATGPGLVGGS